MEKRFWLGVGLMTALLALGLLVFRVVDRSCEPVAGKLEQARAAAEDGQWEQARELFRGALESWESDRPMTAAVSDHGPMEQVDSLFGKLRVYAEEEQKLLFCAGCKELSTLIRALSEAHAGNWWGFF